MLTVFDPDLIDATKPECCNARTADVRKNFSIIRDLFKLIPRGGGGIVNILNPINFYSDFCGTGYFPSDANQLETYSVALSAYSKPYQHRGVINSFKCVFSFSIIAVGTVLNATVTVDGVSTTASVTANDGAGNYEINLTMTTPIPIMKDYSMLFSLDGDDPLSGNSWRIVAIIVS